jgi:hypothetical protein
MRIPDYGNGDWQAKYIENQSLPSITDIGLRDNTIFITLSEAADSIKVIGQGHSTLLSAAHCNSLSYKMASHEPYARITAYFPDGEVIYTNAFARYDASASDSPFKKDSPKINISLTVLFNLLLVFLACVNITILYRLIFKR